ncbi:MAG: thiamine phosphate synthase [Rhodospirillales bacterium]|nr:thiamine phosphate synthase [Rhodospirillales bacterium]
MTLASQSAILNRRFRRKRRIVAGGDTPLPVAILMTDEARLPDPETAISRLPRGAAVILRNYHDPNREDLAVRLLKVCHRRGVLLLIAGDIGMARRIGADGVHFPEHMAARLPGPMKKSSPDWIVTTAAHSPRALASAARIGADAALLSPVFATPSHPDTRTIGPVRFALWSRGSRIAVYALGGIGPSTIDRLKESGMAGIAGIGGLTG